MNMQEARGTDTVKNTPVFENARLAYIKAIGAGDAYAKGLIPQDAAIPNEVQLFTVNDAGGTPLAISDSWAGAYGTAIQNELVPLSLH